MPSHRRPVLAANWKMNHGPTEATKFLDAFLARYAPRDDRTVIIFPPALTFAAVKNHTKGRSDIRLGVQNVHTAEKGAFTGELSATIAADAGAAFVLVGHSERRHVFGETDAQAAQKCARIVAASMTPVLCVGELLEQRERGETERVVLDQLRTGISMLAPAAMRTMIIAYEPVWAIGTGRTATPEDASVVHRVIREALGTTVGAGALDIPILYGGSVNAGNAAALLAADQVDGLLVGGASLEAETWAKICNAG
ncbi:MAG TPA: triose-phosphate isomerase [Gemmatimonadaceae bacterium]|nr:triose-phosphate isomerase [Gemmatimonadaceae bacterium]